MIEAESVRAGVGWFRLPGRAVIAVRGSDRVRFLDGQLTQDVGALAARGAGAGGYAFLLTAQGRIVADLHLSVGSEEIWLECAAPHSAAAIARLDRYLVADDVTLVDEGGAWARFAVEGPNTFELLPEAAGLAADEWTGLEIAGAWVRAVAYGFSGYPALQLWVGSGDAGAVERALLAKGLRHGLVPASPATLEMLRIEAGVPGLEELDEEVLPAETGLLDRAVSFEKGCYTGQEVVARMASRGRMAHRLVGLKRARGGAPLTSGSALYAADRKVGEVTSTAQSSRYGAIGLGFVRTAHSEPGTTLSLSEDSGGATVCALPFREHAERRARAGGEGSAAS